MVSEHDEACVLCGAGQGADGQTFMLLGASPHSDPLVHVHVLCEAASSMHGLEKPYFRILGACCGRTEGLTPDAIARRKKTSDQFLAGYTGTSDGMFKAITSLGDPKYIKDGVKSAMRRIRRKRDGK